MNQLRFTFVMVLMFLGAVCVQAQKAKLKQANELFKRLNYSQAAQLYLSIVDKESTESSEAKINLAECYRKMSNTTESEYWYGQVVRLPEAQPVHKLYYAQALQINGKCEQAKEWYDQYVAEVPSEIRSNLQALACVDEQRNRLADIGVYAVELVPLVNTGKDEFGAIMFGDKLLFSSDREVTGAVDREHTWTDRDFHQVYASTRTEKDSSTFDYSYSKPKYYDTKLNSKFHDGPLCFSRDGKNIFFTRNNLFKGRIGKDEEGVIKLKIFYAENKGGDKWGEPVGVPYNSDEYNVAHPSISADGQTLYFASDMPGGFGGMDVYMSTFQDGRFGPPINMNTLIPGLNTEGHDMFPYIFTKSGKTKLFFASDSHIGLGGLDIYYTEQGENGQWGPIINMGEPINSRWDDLELTLNDEGIHGYFVSDREGGIGLDDIYSWKKTGIEVELFVYDAKTGEAIEGATVTSECLKQGTILTGTDGKARFALPKNKDCTFNGAKEQYNPNSVQTTTAGYDPSQTLFVQIPLDRATQYELVGVAYDQNNMPLPGTVVKISSFCEGKQVLDSIVTDVTGAYRFPLTEGCCYELRGDKKTYLSDVKRDICAKGEPTSIKRDLKLMQFAVQPTTSDRTGTGTFSNSSTYDPNDPYAMLRGSGPIACCDLASVSIRLEHIYYDFNKSYIRDDAKSSLNKVVEIMNNNPDIVVEIGSHTDARASTRYNDKLSQRRAQEAVDYLVTQGISRSRLVAKGYGESQLVNNCANDVECSEEQHQENRRTEFTVIGRTDGTRYNSVRPDMINTDPANPNRRWVWE